jgi:hypothetical protein
MYEFSTIKPKVPGFVREDGVKEVPTSTPFAYICTNILVVTWI